MPMVAMGTSAVAGVIAAASLAYALTLESRLIALNADKSSLCTTVSAFIKLVHRRRNQLIFYEKASYFNKSPL